MKKVYGQGAVGKQHEMIEKEKPASGATFATRDTKKSKVVDDAVVLHQVQGGGVFKKSSGSRSVSTATLSKDTSSAGQFEPGLQAANDFVHAIATKKYSNLNELCSKYIGFVREVGGGTLAQFRVLLDRQNAVSDHIKRLYDMTNGDQVIQELSREIYFPVLRLKDREFFQDINGDWELFQSYIRENSERLEEYKKANTSGKNELIRGGFGNLYE